MRIFWYLFQGSLIGAFVYIDQTDPMNGKTSNPVMAFIAGGVLAFGLTLMLTEVFDWVRSLFVRFRRLPVHVSKPESEQRSLGTVRGERGQILEHLPRSRIGKKPSDLV